MPVMPPPPDPGTQKLLEDAYADARSQLKGQVPDSLLHSVPRNPGGMGASSSVGISADQSPESVQPPPSVDAPPEGAFAYGSNLPVDEPPPGAAPAEAEKPTMVGETGKAWMRGSLALANVLGFAVAGTENLLAKAYGGSDKAVAHDTDAVFDFLKDHVTSARDSWAQSQEATTPQKIVGGAVESLTPMMLGPSAGVEAFALSAATDAAKESIDRGEDLGTAETLALVHGVSATILPKTVFRMKGMLKRVVSSIIPGVALTAGTEKLTKEILDDQGYKEAAAKIDPLDPTQMSISALMQAIFAATTKAKGGKAKTPSAPPVDILKEPPAGPSGSGEPPPPPGPAAVAVPTPPVADVKAPVDNSVPPITVPDKPSAEPLKDLQAQRAELDKGTRKGVYLSPDSVKMLGPEGVKALAGDKPASMNFDGKGGAMIFGSVGDRMRAGKAKSAAKKANAKDDLQKLIGELTGAGTGKTADQTVVIQGQTPEGAVATESAVTPAEAPGKLKEVRDAGHEAVITTPAAAVARREEEIAAQSPPEGAAPAEARPAGRRDTHGVIDTPEQLKAAVDRLSEPAPKAAEIKRKVRTKIEVKKDLKPAEAVTAETAAKTQEVPVPLSPEAAKPDAENTPVISAESAEKPATVQTKGEPLPDLEKAAGNLRDTEAKRRGTGKLDRATNATRTIIPLGERAQNVAAFAQVLKAAAAHAFENKTADESAIDRATKAAKAAERLGDKSAEDIAKGRGVGHAELSAHAAELLAASEQLQGREAPVTATKESLRVNKLAARTAKAKAKIEADRNVAAAVAEAVPDEMVMVAGKARPLKEVVADAKSRGTKATFHALGAELEVDVKDRNRVADAMKKAAETNKAKRDAGKVKSAIPDVVDEVKAAKKEKADKGPLRELTKEEQATLHKKMDNYKIAGDDAGQYHRSELEKTLHELYSPNSAAEHEAVAHLLETADHFRADWRGEAPRDLSGPEELGDTGGIDYRDPQWAEKLGDQAPAGAHLAAAGKRWVELHKALTDSGFYPALQKLIDSPRTVSTHKVLDHILQHVPENNPIRDLVSKVREHVPDYDVRAVTRPDGGGAGLFNRQTGIQLKLGPDEAKNPYTTMALVHEIVHGATVEFMASRPDHPLTLEIERLRDVAEKRMRAMHGDELVDKAVGSYTGKSAMPASGSPERAKIRNFYALKNAREFITETMTNPLWQSMMHESELYATQGEHLPETKSILGRVYKAIAGMLGIKRPDTARLLVATSHITSRIMEAQHKELYGIPDRGLKDAYEAPETKFSEIMGDLAEEHPLPNEARIESAIGARATRVANRFYNAVRKGDIGKLQTAVNALKTFDQLVRDGKQWFNDRDGKNALTEYHEATSAGAAHINEIVEKGQPLVERWTRLSRRDDKTLGEFMKDATIWGIDPSVAKDKHTKATIKSPKFDARFDDFTKRWNNLTPEQQSLFKEVRDYNHWAARKNREAGIDVALRTFSDKDITAAQRSQLYNVRSGNEYASLVGDGKLVDVGDRNSALTKSLETLAGHSLVDGPYFHLGRNGDYVVQIEPEGTKRFTSAAEAEHHAEMIRELSPESDAIVAENPDGSHNVDYSADYVSMHHTPAEAEAEMQMLRDKGFKIKDDVVTRKLLGKQSAPLAAGMEQIVAEASRKLTRSADESAEPLIQALRTSFTQMMAARSAYAGSRLMRKGTGGVKGEEMLRNFADHTQSLAWHTGQLSSVFAKGEALGRLRTATKDANGADQHTMYARGDVLHEINSRLQQETAQYGLRSPINATIAKLGFMNYLASPSHSLVNLTQNFTTAMPVAGARWGYARAYGSFGAAMAHISGPVFRDTVLAHIKPGEHGSSEVVKGVLEAIRKSPRFGKWAQGENSVLKQLIDKGAISTSFSNELATIGRGDSKTVNRVMDYARLMPHMADTFNRVSSALAAIELTNGNVDAAADFVRETHMDYSSGNKPRAFKALNRVPGFNSVTMFRTYTQGMAHLLYANIKNMVTRDLPPGARSRAESAKIVAGVVLSTSILAGITKGAVLEPARLAYYAWHKLFGDDDEYYNIDHAVDAFMADHLGKNLGAIAAGGVPRAVGFDISSRVGLADLFFHDPPDLFNGHMDNWYKFSASLLGPMPQYIVGQANAFAKHMQAGEPYQALNSLVPIKLVQDALRAGQLLVDGKKNARGATIVDPSVGGAMVRFAGFRTADEARAQEKQGVSIEYHEKMKDRRNVLLNKWSNQGYASVSAEITAFNRKNPAHAISVKDFISVKRGNIKTESELRGRQTRDPKLDKMLDY